MFGESLMKIIFPLNWLFLSFETYAFNYSIVGIGLFNLFIANYWEFMFCTQIKQSENKETK